MRDPVRPGEGSGRDEARRDAGDVQLAGALVGPQVAPDGADSSIGLVGGFHRHLLLASVDRADEVLGAIFDPAHGAAQVHRQPGDDDLLCVLIDLGAETPAQIGRYDPDL